MVECIVTGQASGLARDPMPGNNDDLELGKQLSHSFLGAWDNYGILTRDVSLKQPQELVDLVLTSIKSHNRLSYFTLGYFHTLEQRGVKILNDVIKPIIESDLHRRRVKEIFK